MLWCFRNVTVGGSGENTALVYIEVILPLHPAHALPSQHAL